MNNISATLALFTIFFLAAGVARLDQKIRTNRTLRNKPVTPCYDKTNQRKGAYKMNNLIDTKSFGEVHNEISVEVVDVAFKHFRYVNGRLQPYSRKNHQGRAKGGGMTVAAVVFGDGVIIIGTAECSTEDNFCYITGRQIAIADAVQQHNAMLKGHSK